MTNAIDLTFEAKRLTAALGGTWHGHTGMACCPAHDDRSPSLSISPGRTTILLHCFAGCEFGEIIRAIRFRGSLSGDKLPSERPRQEAGQKDYAPLARKIWSEAQGLAGTLAERYLQSRGLTGPWQELRFHRRTPVGAGALANFRPALIAAIRDNSGLIAVHRIVLDKSGKGKARDLANPKLTLGKPRRGAVRLFRASHTLGIAEGIETAKSAAAMLSIPVWAVLGNERFPAIDIPFDVTRLVLLPDRGPAGTRAANLARETFAKAGRVIETRMPPNDHNDWNDADQAEQRANPSVRRGEGAGKEWSDCLSAGGPGGEVSLSSFLGVSSMSQIIHVPAAMLSVSPLNVRTTRNE